MLFPILTGGWKVKVEGAARNSSRHDTQAEAVNDARSLAQNQRPSQIVIHGRGGRFLREFTYDRDTFPPEG